MNLHELALTTPWLATEDAVRQAIQIAARVDLNEALAAELRAEREARPAFVAMRQGRPLDATSNVTMRDGVACIPVTGLIFRYANVFSRFSGGTSVELLARDLQVCADNPMVSAILLVVDSPGGSATGVHDLADAIYSVRAQKPIAAYVEGMAASAAYWFASACGEIALEATAAVGSIGAVMSAGKPDPNAKEIEFVSSQSPNKRLDPTTEGGSARYQTIVDDLATVFIGAVARNRGMAEDDVIQAGDAGGLKVGRAAVAAGLADRIDTLEGMVTRLQQQASDRRRGPAASPRAVAQEGDPMTNPTPRAGATVEAGAAPQPGSITLSGDAAQELLGRMLSTPPAPAAAVEPNRANAAGQVDEAAALRERIAALEAQLAADAKAGAQLAGEQWAARAVAAGKAMPAEAAQLAGLHATMTAEQRAALEAMVDARPAHTLNRELVQVETPVDPTTMGRDKVASLLGLSDLGRAALAAKQK